jgi:hypothetical protein
VVRPDFSLYFRRHEGMAAPKRKRSDKPKKPPSKIIEVVVIVKPPKRPRFVDSLITKRGETR